MIAKIENFIGASLKAHAAGLGAALTLLVADLIGLKTGAQISGDQWVAIAGAYLGVGAVVHVVPNTPAVDEPVAPDAVLAEGTEGANA